MSIDQLEQNFSQLLEALRKELPFFATTGNVYLTSADHGFDAAILRDYQELCQLKLSRTDLEKLGKFIAPLRENLFVLAKEMDIVIEQRDALRKLNSKAETPLSIDENLPEFCQLLQESHRLWSELFAYFFGEYSLKIAPLPTVQAQLLKQPEDYRFAGSFTELNIPSQKMRTNGKPDMVKYGQLEAKEFPLSLEISIHTELVRWEQLLGNSFYADSAGFEENQVVKELFISAASEFYSQIYSFFYQQYFEVKIAYAQLLQNLQARFANPRDAFLQILAAEFHRAPEDTQLKLNQPLAELLKFCQEELTVSDFLDLEKLFLYQLKFRALSQFEEENYQAFFAVDIESLPETTMGTPLLLASAIVVPAQRVYDLAKLYCCGASADDTLEAELTDWQFTGKRSNFSSPLLPPNQLELATLGYSNISKFFRLVN